MLFSLLLLSILSALAVVDSNSIVLGNFSPVTRLSLIDIALAYRISEPDVTVSLLPYVSSDTSISNLTALQVDLIVDNVGLTQQQASSHSTIAMFPLMASAIVPVYRLDAFSSSHTLILSRPVLAQIFLGLIHMWNDTQITALNPSLSLPNTSINVVLPGIASGINLCFTTALSKFLPLFNTTVGATSSPVWPTNAYASYSTSMGTSSSAYAALASDGSISFAAHSEALHSGVSIAALSNIAGSIVTASVTSVSAAATDLGTNIPHRQTSAVDLTDSTKSLAWPIVVMSYVLIDSNNTRAGCANRSALLDFVSWYYKSSAVPALLQSRQAILVPPLVLSEMNVTTIISATVKCNGVTVLPSGLPDTRFNSHGSQTVTLGAQLTSAYASVSNVSFSPLTNNDIMVINQMQQSTVDIGFCVPENINPVLWSAFVNQEDFYVFPTYIFAISWVYNPQISETITLEGNTLVLNLRQTVRLLYGCITAWDDVELTALNPWLPIVLNGSSPPMRLITGCGATSTVAPLTWKMLGIVQSYLSLTSVDSSLQSCVDTRAEISLSGLTNCTVDAASVHLIERTSNEALMPGMVLGQEGAVGFMQIIDDDSYGVPVMSQGGITANSTIAGLLACGLDRFDASSLTINSAYDDSHPDCWPFTQQLVSIVRREYYSTTTNTSACVRGVDALNYLVWLFDYPSISTIAEASNFLRLTDVSADILATYIATLDAATCDGTTILVTAPVRWEVSIVSKVFSLTLAALGFSLCCMAVAVIIRYRASPAIRSTSPAFTVTSVFGIMLLMIAAVLVVQPPSLASCASLNWCWNIGFDLTFIPLFAKTWRIHKIFGGRKLSVIKISNKKLALRAAIGVALSTVYVIVWQAVSPMQPLITPQFSGNDLHEYSQCAFSDVGETLFIIDCVCKGLLLFFGSLMAFQVRHVSSTFNESSSVAVAIYNVAFSVGVIFPIAIVIDAVGDILILLQLFLLFWVSYFTLSILTVLTLVKLRTEWQNRRASTEKPSQSSQFSMFEFLSLSNFAVASSLQPYVQALKAHLADAEKRMRELKSKHPAGGSSIVVHPHPSPTSPQHTAAPHPSATVVSPSQSLQPNKISKNSNNGVKSQLWFPESEPIPDSTGTADSLEPTIVRQKIHGTLWHNK